MFSWLSILLIVAYMGMVVVILLNILIAQLSYTYAEAKKTAKLQYAVDRMFIVSRLETSRFARFVCRATDTVLPFPGVVCIAVPPLCYPFLV